MDLVSPKTYQSTYIFNITVVANMHAMRILACCDGVVLTKYKSFGIDMIPPNECGDATNE